MSVAPGPGSRPFRDPTRIGEARPSHLVAMAGVGAILDLPAMSVVVRGLDAWSPERQDTIDEPRLLAEVRRVLGPQVRALRHAPWDPAESDDPYSRVGVPVTPFPRWVRCPRCHRLGPLDPPGQFELVHRFGRRPDLAKFVHARCPRQAQTRNVNKRACVPARFLVVCQDGHLDDFPYVEYVHAGASEPCGGPQLTMSDASSTLGPRVTVRCAECGASRNIQDAAGRDGWEKLPACRGRQPHLQRFVPCGKPLKLIVLGASNLWFGVTASVLHLPQGQSVDDLVAANWHILGAQPDAGVAQAIIDGMDALRGLRGAPIGEVWACIEKIRAAGGPAAEPDRRDLLDAEWQLLSRPTTDRQDADFRAVPTVSPEGYDRLLDQVVLVSRLREVRGLLGFTRLAAPERDRRWSYNRGHAAAPGFPVARLTLIHTFSHMLIRQVALECGYSSASLRERVYIGTPHAPTAGVLLSTAASDSEGTLGGLVALGHARYLRRLLDQAFDDALHCSSDPLCAEHVPIDPSAALHGAACHACLFASETSCETNNRWLDRAVLADLTGDGLAFTP